MLLFETIKTQIDENMGKSNTDARVDESVVLFGGILGVAAIGGVLGGMMVAAKRIGMNLRQDSALSPVMEEFVNRHMQEAEKQIKIANRMVSLINTVSDYNELESKIEKISKILLNAKKQIPGFVDGVVFNEADPSSWKFTKYLYSSNVAKAKRDLNNLIDAYIKELENSLTEIESKISAKLDV